jgi:hypothetical protein
MKKLSSLLLLLPVLLCTFTATAQKEKSLKKILELAIPREGGANGACVAWHPVLKKYYASMAGNVSFSLGVYDVKGKLLSPVDQEALFDIRGLWYNPGTKTLQTNGYDDFGWGEYTLNKQGFPSDITVLLEDLNQPNEQSVGAYYDKEKVVLFFNEDGNIDKYSIEDGKYIENIELSLGKSKDDDGSDNSDNEDAIENYNSTTAVYTGIAGAEIGLFNFSSKQIELYDSKDGRIARKLLLPADAPAPQFLNFAYCNGIYWLFDKETRTWKGYR